MDHYSVSVINTYLRNKALIHTCYKIRAIYSNSISSYITAHSDEVQCNYKALGVLGPGVINRDLPRKASFLHQQFRFLFCMISLLKQNGSDVDWTAFSSVHKRRSNSIMYFVEEYKYKTIYKFLQHQHGYHLSLRQL